MNPRVSSSLTRANCRPAMRGSEPADLSYEAQIARAKAVRQRFGLETKPTVTSEIVLRMKAARAETSLTKHRARQAKTAEYNKRYREKNIEKILEKRRASEKEKSYRERWVAGMTPLERDIWLEKRRANNREYARLRRQAWREGQEDWIEASRIVRAIAAKHDVTYEDIRGKSMTRASTEARHEAINRVAVRFPEWSSVRLSKMFNRHHTLILYALGRLSSEVGARKRQNDHWRALKASAQAHHAHLEKRRIRESAPEYLAKQAAKRREDRARLRAAQKEATCISTSSHGSPISCVNTQPGHASSLSG